MSKTKTWQAAQRQELMRTPDSMEVNVDDADLELDADGNPMRPAAHHDACPGVQ